MISGLLSLISFIPGVLGLIQKYETAKFNAKVQIYQARTGAVRDVAVTALQTAALTEHENTSKLAIFASNPVMTFLLVGFATPLVLFIWKVVVIDIVVGPGSIHLFGWTLFSWEGNTDPIRGQVADWATTIIGFLFGSGTVMGVTKMAGAWLNKKEDA